MITEETAIATMRGELTHEKICLKCDTRWEGKLEDYTCPKCKARGYNIFYMLIEEDLKDPIEYFEEFSKADKYARELISPEREFNESSMLEYENIALQEYYDNGEVGSTTDGEILKRYKGVNNE